MDFLKFLGISIAAFVLLLIAAMYGYSLGADGLYHDNPALHASAVVVGGIVFSLVPPRHLKVGYFVWILASVVLFLFWRWFAYAEYRMNPNEPNPVMIGVGAGFLWLLSVWAVNPICYFLGKYLWNRFAGPREDALDGRVKPGHDMRVS